MTRSTLVSFLRMPLLSRYAVCLILSLATSLATSRVYAQASFDLQLFRPSPHSHGFITVESGSVAPSLDVRAQAYFVYGYQPLTILAPDGSAVSALDHRFDLNLSGAISLFDRLSIALAIPATLYQAGTLPSSTTPAFKNVAFGDLRLEPKVSILDARRHYLDLALMVVFSVPTATAGSFAGDRTVTVGGELDVSRRFGPVRAAINFGFLWRATSAYYDVRIGPELYARTGVGLDIAYFSKRVPVEIMAEIYGRTSALSPFVNAGESPLEGVLGARYSIIRQVSVTAGIGRGLLPGYGAPQFRAFAGVTVIPLSKAEQAASEAVSQPVSQPVKAAPARDNDGDGILDPVDACAAEPEDRDNFEDEDGCPETDNDKDGIADDRDRCPIAAEDKDGIEDDDGCPEDDADHDGVADQNDNCPNEPEDLDGYLDADGCPERDNDGDGIADADDKCPLEAEVINGVDDFDGCADAGKSLVVITKTAIQILEKVQFQSGNDQILPQSFPLLDQVAATLKNHSEIRLLRVEGHTDSDGADAYNEALSQRRADSVRTYLVSAGVPAERLVAKGFGEAKPIAPNSSRRGKEANRRVEFNVVSDNDAIPATNETSDLPALAPIEKR